MNCRKNLIQIFSILGGILLALVLAEGLLRLRGFAPIKQFYDDPVSGLIINQPGSHYRVTAECFVNDAEVNKYGIRGRDIQKEKPPGVFRILIVGNSFVEAEQVPLQQAFVELLEHKLNVYASSTQFEVIPLGFGNHGTYANLLYTDRLGWQFQPDMIIDLYIGGDFMSERPEAAFPPIFHTDGSLDLNPPVKDKSPMERVLRDALTSSQLFVKLGERWMMARTEVGSWFASSHAQKDSAIVNDDDGSVLWHREEDVFQRFSREASEHHASFIIASWMKDDSLMGMSGTKQAEHLEEISAKNGVLYTDLTSDMTKRTNAEGTPAIFSCDGHWNSDGHARFAQGLFEFLLQKKLLPL